MAIKMLITLKKKINEGLISNNANSIVFMPGNDDVMQASLFFPDIFFQFFAKIFLFGVGIGSTTGFAKRVKGCLHCCRLLDSMHSALALQ